jgi:hypothetical protein
MSEPKKNVRKHRAAKVKEAADRLGITERHARRMSEAELADIKTIEGAKLRKVQLECQRIERQLEIDAGNWIHKDVVQEQTIKNVAVIKACLGSLVAVLPGQLEGLMAAQMAPIIEREVNKTFEAMARA